MKSVSFVYSVVINFKHMKQIWIITKRELKTFFDSLIAYIMIILFLGASGIFTWLFMNDIFFIGQASLSSFFSVAYIALPILIPALTMRVIAEERKTGTLEILLTKAITDRQLVIGKFLGVFILVCITLALTIPYYITVANIGPIDHGATISGYLGLLLMSAFYIAIGILTSTSTSNQIVAFLLALISAVMFHIIFGVLSSNLPGILGDIFNYLNLTSHFTSITRGVIDSRDIIFFLSGIFISLKASEIILSRRQL